MGRTDCGENGGRNKVIILTGEGGILGQDEYHD